MYKNDRETSVLKVAARNTEKKELLVTLCHRRNNTGSGRIENIKLQLKIGLNKGFKFCPSACQNTQDFVIIIRNDGTGTKKN